MISMTKKIPVFTHVKPPFILECTPMAAIHNWKITSKFWSLEDTIQAFKFSPIHYGSELKPASILAPLLQDHKYWRRLEEMLSRGSKFPIQDYNDES